MSRKLFLLQSISRHRRYFIKELRIMVPKFIITISSIICLLYLESINCQSHGRSKPNPRQFENPMRDFNKCLSALSVNKKLSRDHCFSQLCTYVTGLFECKVLQCKNKFPGKNESQKTERCPWITMWDSSFVETIAWLGLWRFYIVVWIRLFE